MKRPGHPIFRVRVRFEPDIVIARQKTRRLSELLHFENQDQVRLATAVSELTRNLHQYAGGGHVEYFLSDTDPQTLLIRVVDEGPGIAELDAILNGTYKSKTGLGIGLMGLKRLMDVFEIETAQNGGTTITIGKRLPRKAPRINARDLAGITEHIVKRAAESAFEELQNQNRDLLTTLEELRASREELSELNRELGETNRGVVALYAELDEKAASLQRANEVKTRFLSHMTHEFRTPLSSMISLTRILLQEMDGPLLAEQKKQVNYVRTSAESLLELVSDLLDLAKVEAGKVTMTSTPFALDDVLGGLRGMFRPLLNDAKVELTFSRAPELESLRTDQAKLTQILRNLISNAIKFTDAGKISVEAVAEAGDRARFSVRDTGVGIDPKYHQTIFEDFAQVPSRLQPGQTGTGLGLPLSRKLARLLGGDLWVESQSQRGSTFHVVLPRVYGGEREAVLINEFPETSGPCFNVLLVDDDLAAREKLKALVREEIDARFIEVTDGSGALAAIVKSVPDLIFLDLGLPGDDGFEVLRQIRAKPGGPLIPVIINTEKDLPDVEKHYLEGETFGVLSKLGDPASVRNLRRALIKAGFDYKSM